MVSPAGAGFGTARQSKLAALKLRTAFVGRATYFVARPLRLRGCTSFALTQHHICATTRPFPGLTSGLNYFDFNESSTYNGLQLHDEHRRTSFLATACYAYSHALDNTYSQGSGTPVTVLLHYDQAADYGNASQNERQVASTSFLYNLTFGRDQKFGSTFNCGLDLLSGGWRLNGILLSTG